MASADRFFSELPLHSMARIWIMPNNNQGDAKSLALYDILFDAAKAHHQFLNVTLFDGIAHQCTNLPMSNSGTLSAGEISWIDAVVKRHANEPTSAMYEVANEAEGRSDAWYSAVGARIKADNPHALVGTGGGNAIRSVSRLAGIAGSPNIDLISLHEYCASGGISGAAGIFSSASAQVNKPWYVGESGFEIGCNNSGSAAGNAAQVTTFIRNYMAQANCAGYSYWDFRPGGSATVEAQFGGAIWAAITGYKNPYPGGVDSSL